MFLCSSCAPDRKWIHPSNSEEQKKQDENECGWEAVRSAGPTPQFGTQGHEAALTRQMNQQKLIMDRCMKERGYKEVRQ